MKKFLIFLLLLLPLAIASCGGDDKDEPETTANDPEGTITANLMNTFYCQGYYWYDGIELDLDSFNHMTCYLGLNSSNNLQAPDGMVKIVSVGKVKGLSSITKLPESGWAEQTAAIPGNGYIYKCTDLWETHDLDYAIIYVVDYIKNTSGGIIGVTIKYKNHWSPSN